MLDPVGKNEILKLMKEVLNDNEASKENSQDNN